MKDFLRKNGILLLIIALLLSILIGVTSSLMRGNADPLSNVVSTVTAPVRGAVAAVADWAEGIYQYVFQYGELQEELSDLRAQVAELEGQVRQGQEASRENEQLRQLLDLQERRRDFVFESARVTERSTSTGSPPSPWTRAPPPTWRRGTASSPRRGCWWGWSRKWG